MADISGGTSDTSAHGLGENSEAKLKREHAAKSAQRKVMVAGAVLLAVGIGAALGVVSFVQSERDRDLTSWQIRLGIVAESRSAAVSGWFAEKLSVVGALADDTSVRLYMTELSFASDDPSEVTDSESQLQYLRNYLAAEAQREGFDAVYRGEALPANVVRPRLAGIALTNAKGRILTASTGTPEPTPELLAFLKNETPEAPRVYDIFSGETGLPTMALVAPVFPVQGDAVAENIMGYIIAIGVLDDNFYGLLKQPGAIEKTAETFMARVEGATVKYLSPLADGTAPMEKQLALDTPDLAAALAVQQPGAFGPAIDYAGKKVLVTGRRVEGTNWVIVRTISIDEAMAESEARTNTLLVVLLLAIFGAGVTIIAVWRQSTSSRAAAAALEAEHQAERFKALSDFMRVVTDSQPTAITVVNPEGNLTFANEQAGVLSGMLPGDMRGRDLQTVFGAEMAKGLNKINREVVEENHDFTHIVEKETAGVTRSYQTNHIGFKFNPNEDLSVLMVMDDVTDLVNERKRREESLRALVKTIVGVVDKRDPFSALHSERVAKVSEAVAEEMGLSEKEIEAASFAGSLINIGKIFVPEELLTKQGKLTEDEMAIIRESYNQGADLLKDVQFDGPVLSTIRQVRERVDGSGEPHGLTGDKIIPTAQVVAVANMFVAMTSARAFRAGLSFDEALNNLNGQVGKAFVRQPITALANLLDNRGMRDAWKGFGDSPAD